MITYNEINVDKLKDYDKIPFKYTTNKKYEITKINRGLGGFKMSLIDIPTYEKDFGARTDRWIEMFDLSNWKFYAAYDGDKMIGGCVLATKTDDCLMLEGRDDLAVLWDIRVNPKYQHQGIGQSLFNMAKEIAKNNGFKQLKIECQNTNVVAVNFYHKQGAILCAINEYAYCDYPNEIQLLWYLDL